MTESRDSGRRAREIFRSLTELPQSHRPARLREACHGNADLEGAVRELLGRFEGEDAAFLEPSHRLEALGEIPHRIGSYRILSLLGEGGTGIVFRAERDWPKHEVALKLIPPRPFLHRREVLQRFAHEAELLARLRHPSITQLYEAGATETELGPQPFLSMELVEGRPITDYVTEHESSLEERLRLLLRVCRAVEHAHERGVVHRDLKPSNILVDAAGHPKVVDFGIAKLLAEEPRSDGPNTRDGELLGTPAYMSPEQARGKGNIDGRADVYALGVLGYELLSGRLPRRIELGRTESYHEEPTRLGRIDRRWRGDIETVFRKALEPDLGERYATVGEMADDLERYLNHEPIQARRASTWYQLRKFARRNRTLVSGAAAVSVTLAAGLIATFVLLGMTREEAGRTERVLTYFDEVIASMGPDGAGKDQRISSLILGELETLEERFGDEPLLLARVSDTFGRALLGQGFLVEAEPLLRRAVDIRNEQLGSTSPEALDSRLSLAELTYQRGRYLAALEEARSIRTLTEVVPEQHEERGAKAGVLEGRILLEIGQFEKAEALLDELLASQVKAELRPALEELHVQSLLEQDRLEDARRVALEGVKSARDLFGEEHPMTLRARQAAARVLMQSKNPEEAGEELEEVLRLTQARHSDHHSFLADVLTNLGRVAHLSGDLEEAQELYREAEQIQIGLVATSWHPEQIERLLLSQRAERESTGEDAADLASSLKDVESTSGADSPQALAIRIRLALAYRSQGKLVEAATEQARVVETFERQFGRG
ncbi:MAG: tetratricopeptide repeat protein, partial [Planctomycetota bacterium]